MQKFARPLTVTVFATFAAIAIALAGATTTLADSQRVHFATFLTGYQETPQTINSPGHGTFTLDVVDDTMLRFTLTFADLTGNPLVAHVHFGARATTGGVAAFLCGGSTKPACPAATSGTVTGTIISADIIGPTGQGMAAGAFADLVRAIRAGVTYANVHTPKFPSGEIRGQIHGRVRADAQHD